MTITERMLVGALFSIVMALVSWLLLTVSFNSSRISVTEYAISDLKDNLREHRFNTEKK